MSDRARLLILSFSVLRSDPRVLKQLALLSDRFEITTCGYGGAPDGVVRHVELPLEARAWTSDRLAMATRRYRHAYRTLPAVVEARERLRGETFDIVLANDLNTVPLALELEPLLGVHADLHEYSPSEKENEPLWRWAVAPFMRWICRTYLPRIASGTTVGEGIAERYRREFGVRLGVVPNAAPYAELEPRRPGDGLRLIYSGAGQRYRKVELTIEAMRDVPVGITLDMIVMPNEPAYVDELRDLAATVPAVSFREPVPYEKLVETVAEYDVCVIAIPGSTFNLANGLPNKFFEAVQGRVGLLIGPSPEMVRYLERYGLGAMTDDFTVEAIHAAIASLDAATVWEWKLAADRAAHDLSAEVLSRAWTDAIDALAARRAG